MVFDNRILNGMDEEAATAAQMDRTELEAELAKGADISEEVNDKADMQTAFSRIRQEVPKSVSSAELTELYRQAGSLIKLLDNPTFYQKVGARLDEIRSVAEEELAQTAWELNNRAKEVGARSQYAERWGG